MENQEWSRLGDEVKNIVESAVETQDFKELNHAIEKTVTVALDQVGKTVNQAGKTIQDSFRRTKDATESRKEQMQRWEQTRQAQQAQYRSYNAQAGQHLSGGQRPAGASAARAGGNSLTAVNAMRAQRYRVDGVTTGVSIFMMISGFMLLAPCAVICLIMLLVWAAGDYTAAEMVPMLTFAGIPTALFALLGGSGVHIYGRQQRFKRYMLHLGNREFCSVEELQGIVQKSRKFVLKDLTRMIRSRMFRQGHLDKQGTCLMVTDRAYQQYLTAQVSLEQRQREQQEQAFLARQRELAEQQRQAAVEQKVKEKQKEVWKNPNLSPEAKAVIREGLRYLEQIKQSNNAIPGEEISQKISRMELVIGKIFDRVEQHPELIDDLRKFMDYYLPTTVKLLKAYEEMDAQPVQGPNIVSSKQEIENTLDTINQAFENLLDSFFENAAWDISTDISVLQTMLAQEGLTGKEFVQSERPDDITS